MKLETILDQMLYEKLLIHMSYFGARIENEWNNEFNNRHDNENVPKLY